MVTRARAQTRLKTAGLEYGRPEGFRMEYSDFEFKIPVEEPDYAECSAEVTKSIESIIEEAIQSGRNKIFINTNLRLGLPMENINKIAGPFVEAWAFEVFYDELNNSNSPYRLVNVETKARLHMADVILQFQRKRDRGDSVTAEVDVKATAEDIVNSGKSPNITSYNRIRSAYVNDPDYMFIILSLKHRVYSKRNDVSALMDGIMEVVGHNAYDLKYVAKSDISYNPALGSGQIQIRDIHYIGHEYRTAWEFCQILDAKFLNSSRRNITEWEITAKKCGWIKNED